MSFLDNCLVIKVVIFHYALVRDDDPANLTVSISCL